MPDYGPHTIHPTGGATAIGARMPMVYFNINLDTPNVEIAREISKRVRNRSACQHRAIEIRQHLVPSSRPSASKKGAG